MTSDNINSRDDLQPVIASEKLPKIGMWSAIEKVIHRISKSIRWVSIAVLLIMTFFVTADVVGRYLLSKPIKGGVEIQELMMVLIVFLAFPYCTLEKKHIYVELLIDHLKGRSKAIMHSFAYLIGLVIIVIITWQIALRGWNGLTGSENELTQLLQISIAPFIFIAAVGLVLMSLEWSIDLVHSILQAIGKKPS